MVKEIRNRYFTYRRTTHGKYKETYHAHPGLELCFVHDGAGSLWIDRHYYEITSGSLLIFQPFQLHRVQMHVTEDNPFVRTVLTLNPEEIFPLVKSFPQLHAFVHHLIHDKNTTPVLEGWTDDHIFIKYIEYQTELWNNRPDSVHQEAYHHLLLTCLRLIQQNWPDSLQSRTHQPRQKHPCEQMMQWIELHYDEAFKLERMAHDLHLTSNYLSHLFKQETGTTITEYVMITRLRAACRLLSTTELAVSEIAYRIGLTNTSYFCQAFKKRMNISPHQYRKVNQK